MLKYPSLALLALLLTLTSGCSGPDTHEKLGLATIEVFNDYAKVLEGVTDAESARSAVPELEKITQRMRDLNTRAKALGDPDPADQAAFQSAHGEKMDAAFEAFGTQMVRIEGLGEDVVSEIEGVLLSLRDEFDPAE